MDEMLLNANTMTAEPVLTTINDAPIHVEPMAPAMMEQTQTPAIAAEPAAMAPAKKHYGRNIAGGLAVAVAGGLVEHYIIEPALCKVLTKRKMRKEFEKQYKAQVQAKAAAAAAAVEQPQEKKE